MKNSIAKKNIKELRVNEGVLPPTNARSLPTAVPGLRVNATPTSPARDERFFTRKRMLGEQFPIDPLSNRGTS